MRSLRMPLAGVLATLVARLDPNRSWCYSQEGEDLVVQRLLEGSQAGFYVDVGAHHPRRFSNTQLFYERGWRGINIDPSPAAIGEFKRLRMRDVNLQLGIAEQAGELTYYIFDEPALNTFDQALMHDRERNTRYRMVATMRVPVERLEGVLDRYMPQGQAIDFLSIDVEGLDLQVLRSSNWERYRPGLLLVEALGFRLVSAAEHPIHRFMEGVGYELVAKTLNTLFYRDSR